MSDQPEARSRAPVPRVWRIGLAVVLAVTVVVAVIQLVAAPFGSHRAASGSVDAYRGLGTWVDIWDANAWADPAAAVAAMKERGVRTLFLETSNFTRESAFMFPDGVRAFVDAADEDGLSIVAWYLPGFADVNLDTERSLAAIRYRTPSGNGFDSFALDIESSQVRDPVLRTQRLLDLSSRIRASAPEGYSLGAIIPAPLGLRANRARWPGFPYRSLASLYDVFLPMTYFTWTVSGEEAVHAYTAENIDAIRVETGDPSVPIHVIGGIAGAASPLETAGFVHAVRERGILGASFYTFSRTTDGEWRALSNVAANPVESPALPVPLSFVAGLGNIPGGDRTHPKEVVYETGGQPGSWRLTYQAFDLQKGEVAIWVNWTKLKVASPTEPGAWSGTRGLLVPDAVLSDSGPNYIAFVARGAGPDWSVWGVRAVGMVPGPSPSVSPSMVLSPSPGAAASPSP